MTVLFQSKISTRARRTFAGLLAVCFAVAFVGQAPVFAGGGGGGAGDNSSGFSGGVSITINAGKQKKTTKKKATKKKRKKAVKKPAKKKAARAAPAAIPKYRSNHVLALFVTGTPDQIIDDVAAEFGLARLADAEIQLIDGRLVKYSFKRRMTALRALELANDPRVISAQPNYLYQMAASAAVQFAVKKLEIPKVHEIATGKGVIVAVIDSGIRTKHPAFAKSVIEQFNAVGKRGHKDFSHGTGIASIIAARTGMIGVAPNAQILSSIAFAKDKKRGPAVAETYDIVRSVDWAVSKQAQIINMSFTGARDPAFDDVLNAARKAGVIPVAAVGNLGSKAPPAYPAAYPQVIAVTATDAKDRLYKRANRGAYVTVAAPGVDVLVARRTKSYGLMSGTSAATGYVTGALALLIEHRPQLDSETAVGQITATARDLGKKGRDRQFGHGLLNIYDVVTSDLAAKAPEPQDQSEVIPASAVPQTATE
ncbi:MAG: S8 family serine peptidase [Hyphomicrobiales bacterium]|nr:S8 family serine peptidase [Hyphomicrobiales bacterium]